MAEDWTRAILHVDMDAFYASVEQRDRPELCGSPVIVGGAAERRGVVSAASYEARAFGVQSAMPTARAQRLCPQAVFLPVRMDRYTEVSRQVHELFTRFTPVIERISVDEAFLDVTGCQRLLGPPARIGRDLKALVRAETGLTASVGAAPTRYVAKVASDLEKPDGLVVIPEDQVLERLAPLPVRRIWGVGRTAAARLGALGIETIGQLRAWPRATLVEHFGAAGAHLHDFARGIDPTPVHEGDPEKSVSNETTFATDVTSVEDLERTLLALSDSVATRVRAKGLTGRTVQLKVRYQDFTMVTRRITLPSPTCVASEIHATACRLLEDRTEAGTRPVRLIGVGLSGFDRTGQRQTSLFGALGAADPGRHESAERAADAIRKKLGPRAIGRGSSLLDHEPEG